MKIKKRAVVFDEFARSCKYFDCQADVNNGYGCTHPQQDERDDDDKGKSQGCCFCFSCPLGMEAENEDVGDTSVDWDGLNPEYVEESEYLLIDVDDSITPEEKEALSRYDRYIHPYDPKWLKAHPLYVSEVKLKSKYV